MNSLAAYGSSDEEDDIQPEKPAKIAKIETSVPQKETTNQQTVSYAQDSQQQAPDPGPSLPPATLQNDPSGPAPGPSAPQAEVPSGSDTDAQPFSPYTYERQRLRELTMPTIPNFDIPDSPPPPLNNSEEAATLAATTKKMERFLELKKQGVHFNERLQNTNSLRNPSLLPKLMEFAGIGVEDSYRSSLSEEVAVPVEWPEEVYVEGLLRASERKEKKRVAEREGLDFVPASKEAGGSEGAPPKKKSKFHKR